MSEEINDRVESMLLGESEPTYLVCDEPLKTHWLENAITEQVTEDRLREIVAEIFNQMIEPAAARISESVKQMIESMDE